MEGGRDPLKLMSVLRVMYFKVTDVPILSPSQQLVLGTSSQYSGIWSYLNPISACSAGRAMCGWEIPNCQVVPTIGDEPFG